MPKTEVILVSNIVGLGAESDQVKVAPGYARNYLFPRRLAVPLNIASKKQIESLRKRRAEREAADLNAMSEVAASIGKLLLKVVVKTGDDGKMFGAVTAGTIADELKNQFAIALDKKKIHLELPLRSLGEHEVEMRLHPDVNAKLKVLIESSTPPAPALEEPKSATRFEGRFRRSDRPSREGVTRLEDKGAKPAPGDTKTPGPKAGKPHADRPAKGPAESKAKAK